MVTSRQVVVEADRNFLAKLLRMVNRFRHFIDDLKPLMIDDPSPGLVRKAASIVGRKDASTLAAAREGKVDFLVTLDKKHFLSARARKGAGVAVVTPSEFLRVFENLLPG